MAPEVANGEAVTAEDWRKADVFGLGGVLYYLLTGGPPYTGQDATEVWEQAKRGQAKAPRHVNPRTPWLLSHICRKAMRKEPERRYASARAMGWALWLYLWGWYLLAGFGAAALLALVTWLGTFSGTSGQNAPLKVELRVLHYAYDQQTDREKPQGPIGGESMEGLVDDRILVRAELSSPGYCYIIGFNFDGKEQLLWPRNEDLKRCDPTIAPPRLDRVQCPPPPAGGANQRALKLDDDPRGGMQAYIVVASRQPLPAYEEWKRRRAGQNPWQYLPARSGVWRSDGEVLDTVQKGDVRVRASEVDVKDQPPLLQLARWARGPGVTVEAVAFPVYQREKR
jgi:hypothetical protein